MVHISLGCFEFIQSVDSLCFGKRSQSCHCTDLCLSTCEHCRTVYSRNNVYFCCQRTNLCDLATIRTFVIFENHLTYSLLLVLVYSLAENCQPFFIVCKCILKSCCDLADIFFSCLFIVCEYSFFHFFGRYDLFDCLEQFFRNCAGSVKMFFFTAFCNDLIDETNDLLVYIMCLVDCFDHGVFWNFVCTCFDHDNFFSGRSNCKLKVRKFFLRK